MKQIEHCSVQCRGNGNRGIGVNGLGWLLLTDGSVGGAALAVTGIVAAASQMRSRNKGQKIRLGGWQRIGIVLSVVWWLFVVGYWCFHPYGEVTALLSSQLTGQLDSAATPSGPVTWVVFCAVPVGLASLVFWLVSAIIRWIARGFVARTIEPYPVDETS